MGRPTETKKGKARNAGSSGSGFDVSINLFVDFMNANSKELYYRSDARWKEIKETHREKLALERERVLATKIESEAMEYGYNLDIKYCQTTDVLACLFGHRP
jgi:hypothetical protein